MADFLTRALALVAPMAALRRMQARVAMQSLRAYEGAGQNRRTRNWRTSTKGPVEEVGDALERLRARSRDLTRNNPYAKRAVDIVVAHQVGFGIMPRPRTGSAAADKRLKMIFAEWVKTCDVTGVHDFYGLQALAARARAESGEVLIRLWRNRGPGPVPLQLQVLEPDHLDHNKNEENADGSRIVYGVELDPYGARVAYWLFRRHPGDSAYVAPRLSMSERVPAADVIHMFRADRPGQVRGVPDCAPVVTRMRGLDDYQEAELERARVQACLAAFITTPSLGVGGPLAGLPDAASGERRQTMSPGMMEQLLPGEDIKFLAPAAGDAYGDHVKTVLRAIAVGFGVTYHQLTADLSDANYSSLRAGNIEFRRLVEQAQYLMLIPQLCDRVWTEFVRVAVLANAVRPRAAGYAVEWVPPAFEAVDPLKDAQAERERIDLMLTSPQRAIAAQGFDPDEILAEAAEWKAKKEAAGLGAPAPAPQADPENADDDADDAEDDAETEDATDTPESPPA